jgi:hypothetical protein
LGAISDFLEWFGLGAPQQLVSRWLSGKMSAKDVAIEMAKGAVNKAVGQVGPQYKLPTETLTGRKMYPDVFEPAIIRDRGLYLAEQFGLGGAYRRIAGLPHKSYQESLQNVLAYAADPEESAYYEILDEKQLFLKNKGEYRGYGGSVSPRSSALYNIKMAIRYEDKTALDKYLQEYVNLGGTKEGIETSLRDMEPLFGLNSKLEREFKNEWLDDEGRRRLEQAEAFYKESVLGSERLPYWGREVSKKRPEK